MLSLRVVPFTRVEVSEIPEAAEVAEMPEAADTVRDGWEPVSEVLRVLGCGSRKLGVVVLDVNVAEVACWSENGSLLDSLLLPGTTLPLVNM